MLIERIYEWARLKPARPALIYNDRTFDYAGFARAIAAACTGLRSEALPAGTVAVVATGRLADAWALILALRALGLTTIHVNSLKQAEALGVKDVSCIVTTAAERAAAATAEGAVSPFAAAKMIALSPFEIAAKNGCEPPAGPAACARPGGHILYTSGTTGGYKKVIARAEDEDRANALRAEFFAFDGNTIYHGVDLGLWTGAAYKFSSAAWHAGGAVVIDQRDDKFKNFFRHRVSFSICIPWMARALVKAQAAAAGPVDGFTLVAAGGFLGIELAELALRKVTRSLIINYASTELNRPCLSSRFETKEDLLWLTPVEAGLVEVVDDDGRQCADDRQGELRIALSDIDCREYLDDAAASSRVFRDGFFHPGDLAVRRADGRIRILGRSSDVVNLKGSKVAAAPIEQEIAQFLKVSEVCIFSGLSEAGHEELIVAIESERNIRRALLQAVAARFARFDKVRFSVCSAFPRAAAGTRKTNRALLRELVFEELSEKSRRMG